jgi:hypothetical protein
MTGTEGVEVNFYSFLTSTLERRSKQRLGIVAGEQNKLVHYVNLSNVISLVPNVLLSTVFSSAFSFFPSL